jgi:hypothetical protein
MASPTAGCASLSYHLPFFGCRAYVSTSLY